jgi:prophage regulatory protein
MSALKAEKGIAYSRPHLYRMIAAGSFPKPVHLSPNRIGFVEAELDEWLRSKIAERDADKEAA